MTATLRPLRDDEFDAWLSAARAGYAASIEHDGGMAHDHARAKADRDTARLVPDARVPDDHAVFVIEDNGRAVGRLWVAEQMGEGGRALFVYEVAVDEDARGKGYGRLAMEFVEEEARRRGLDRVALNVFGGNEVARGLYRSLGYREAAVTMEKRL